MGIDVYPPNQAATGQGLVLTKSQTSSAGAVDLTTPDPFGVNVNSFIPVNLLYANAAFGGAIFSATITGSNGDRFSFQAHPLGAGGSGWTPVAAMDMASGYWDCTHRTYDSGGIYSWLVPAPGCQDLRMVRQAGAVGAGTCIAYAVASHVAFPSPPKFVGKRDVSLIIRPQIIPLAYGLVPFDALVAGDDRVRTLTTAATSRFTSGGRRLWVQGYDLAYQTSGGADRVRVDVIARANGVVSTNEANSPPIFELGLLSAPGRAVTLPEPIELQNSLGGNQGSIGIKAVSSVAGGGVNMLNGTIFCFETL